MKSADAVAEEKISPQEGQQLAFARTGPGSTA
jgi:hypothetical protein